MHLNNNDNYSSNRKSYDTRGEKSSNAINEKEIALSVMSSTTSSSLNYPASNAALIPPTKIIFSSPTDGEGSGGSDDNDVLGKGGFGVVRRAKFMGQDVAVKALTVNDRKLDPLKAIALFVSEAEKMREIRHPRIVEFKGFVLELFAIVMEFLPGGTLYDYIKTNPKMPWSERYWCATDVAEGMRFLHSKSLANGREKVQVFHQDLKTLNVLLLRDEKGRLRAKISDFGLSGKN